MTVQRAMEINWIRHRLIKVLAATLFGLMPLLAFSGAASATGTATLTLIPGSGSYHTGDTFTVTIHEYSTDLINAVEADLGYDQAQLQFVSLTTNQTTFDIPGPTTGGNGKVRIPVAVTGSGLSGDQVVGTITFKVVGSSGSSNIIFLANPGCQVGCYDSAIIRTSDTVNIWDGNPAGATVTIATATTGGGATQTTTTTAAPKTAPKTSVKTAAPTTPTPSPTPAPVVAPTNAGYSVAIKVLDANSKIVKGATVTLDGKAASSYDITGIAAFTNVASGNHTVVVTAGKRQTTQSITVEAKANNLEVQQFGVKVAASHSQSLIWIVALIIALLVISGGGWTLGQTLTHHHRTAATAGVTTNSQITTAPESAILPTSPTAQPVTPANPLNQVFYPQSSNQAAPNNPIVNNNQDNNHA